LVEVRTVVVPSASSAQVELGDAVDIDSDVAAHQDNGARGQQQRLS
jgi:hypothetical protein